MEEGEVEHLDLDVEEGLLDETRSSELLGDPTKFYNLQAEETGEEEPLPTTAAPADVIAGTAAAPAALAAVNKAPPAANLGQPVYPTRGDPSTILFSPEGNEGFLFTDMTLEMAAAPPAATAAQAGGHMPRELNDDDHFFRRFSLTPRDSVAERLLDARQSVIVAATTAATSAQQQQRGIADIFGGSGVPAVWPPVGTESVGASPRSAGYLTDRATSPSVASVASQRSVSSQISMSGRRYLEWDYGSDLGYLEGQVSQVEAAQSLSTLEKLAIGTYTEYLRDAAAAPPDYRDHRRQPFHIPPEETGGDFRMAKFAESLMRQRQLQQQQELYRQDYRSRPIEKRSVDKESRRSRSRETNSRTLDEAENDDNDSSAVDEEAGVGGIRRSLLPSADAVGPFSLPSFVRDEEFSAAALHRRRHRHQLKKSSSLTDFDNQDVGGSSGGIATSLLRDDDLLAAVGPRSLSTFQLPLLLSGRYHAATAATLSSSSSGSTRPGQQAALVVQEPPRGDDAAVAPSSRYSSRRSISNSFETVVVADWGASSGKDSLGTEDEAVSSIPAEASRSLETAGQKTWDEDAAASHLHLPPLHSSGQSSAPSSSDEERRGPGGRGRGGVGGAERRSHAYQAEDTSTLESVPMIDRAKSFEYIPGESFHLQENSSSYEYLPGHLVNEQRPPTVLNIAQRRSDQASSQSPEGAAETTAGDNAGHVEPGLPPPPPLDDRAVAELEQLSAQLRDKTRDLLAANLSQTKYFFKKLKKYIDYMSAPSDSVEECRLKQHLAARIMRLLANEESRLEESADMPSSSSVDTGARRSFRESVSTPASSEPRGLQPRGERHVGRNPTTSSSSTSVITDESSLYSSVAAERGSSWRQTKTRSEEVYERRQRHRKVEDGGGGGVGDLTVGELQAQRVRHLKNLRKELRKLEQLEQKKILLTRREQTAAESPASCNTTTPTATIYNNGSSGFVSPPKATRTTNAVVPSGSPARKLTFVKKTAAAASRHTKEEGVDSVSKGLETQIWSLAVPTPTSPDKTDHGVESIRNTASSSGPAAMDRQRRRRCNDLQDKAVQAELTNVTESSDATSLTSVRDSGASSSLSSAQGGDQKGQRRQQRQGDSGGERSRSQQTETVAAVTRRLDTRTEQSTLLRSVSKSSRVSSSESSCQAPPERRKQGESRKKLPSSSSDQPSMGEGGGSSRRQAWPAAAAPTPSVGEEEQLSLRLQAQQADKENQAGRPKKVITSRNMFVADGTRKSKPVAYYLPLDNLSPVRIGRRVLQDRSNQETGQLSAGNRHLLSAYMASLDAAAAAAATTSSLSSGGNSSIGVPAAGSSTRRPQLTLQDALLTQRPNFVRRAEHRRVALQRIKAARLARAEKQEEWLQHLRELSPASRRAAQPTYSPVPQVRLFSHREMVAKTRRKFSQLPEVRGRVVDRRKAGKMETNRIRAELYSRHLQRRVVNAGQVSLQHHDRVFL